MSVERPDPKISLSGAMINGIVAPIGGFAAFVAFLNGALVTAVLLGMVAVMLVLVQRVYVTLRSIEQGLATNQEDSSSGATEG